MRWCYWPIHLDRTKSWLLAHDDYIIPATPLAALQQQVKTRTQRMPLAYVRGFQEFYGREFVVTPSVLIPRPETEQIITQLTHLQLPPGARLLDVGTGSGAIGITAALEIPGLQVEACDISQDALDVARNNAARLDAAVTLYESDLLAHAKTYDVIAANLPYVGPDWLRSPETDFEPGLALFADNNGLALIEKLLHQTLAHLTPGGHVLIEADPRQFGEIRQTAPKELELVDGQGFVLTFKLTNN